jgi:hypothetical protein
MEKNAYDGLEQPFTFPKQAILKQSLMNLDKAILSDGQRQLLKVNSGKASKKNYISYQQAYKLDS